MNIMIDHLAKSKEETQILTHKIELSTFFGFPMVNRVCGVCCGCLCEYD